MHDGIAALIAAIHSTGDPIIHRRRIATQTSLLNITAFKAIAKETVITIDRRAGKARPPGADIPLRAGIAIITREGVVCVYTAQYRITGIIGASVAIIAIQDARPGATACGADIIQGAFIPVITEIHVEGMGAALHRVAPFIRTGVVVITARWQPAHTLSPGAGVVGGARAVIITKICVVLVGASSFHSASIRGAWIQVIAVGPCSTDTFSPSASVARCAGVVIITGKFIVLMGATNG